MPNAALSAAAAADPGVGGAWSTVIPTDVVPIFQAVLPNGKVLMWDSVGDGPAESYTDHIVHQGAWCGTRRRTRRCAGT